VLVAFNDALTVLLELHEDEEDSFLIGLVDGYVAARDDHRTKWRRRLASLVEPVKGEPVEEEESQE